jgi:ATPase subunit of ABC transporter with duplicated ATPase domains
VDLINDVATDIIDMDFKQLSYYPGNYDSYRLMKDQQEMYEIKQSVTMEKKREKLKNTLQSLKEKPVPRRGGAKKKAKAVACQRKKLNKHETLEKSINASIHIPPRKGLTASQRLKLAETMKVVPDKEVQFV